MKSISVVALASALFLGMSCQAFRLVNRMDYPLVIYYQKYANEVLLTGAVGEVPRTGMTGVKEAPSSNPERQYTLTGKETKDLGKLQDGDGVYLIGLRTADGKFLYSKVGVWLSDIWQIYAGQPEGYKNPIVSADRY